MSSITSVPKEALETTRAANTELLGSLPFADKRYIEEAKRGYIAPLLDGGVIKNEQGRPVWDMTRFSFIKEGSAAPDTAKSVVPIPAHSSGRALQGRCS